MEAHLPHYQSTDYWSGDLDHPDKGAKEDNDRAKLALQVIVKGVQPFGVLANMLARFARSWRINRCPG